MSEVDALKALVGDAVTEVGRQTEKPVAVIATPRILEALRVARDELKYDHLADYTATDHPLKKHLEITYNLWSYAKHKHLVLKTRVPRDNAVAPSLVPLWSDANWDERELFDLLGIRFEGHPNLKRLFLPENWKGHPLRKDYPLQEEQWIGMDEKGNDVAYQTPGDDRW
jgi:NADH-quinone oxidoreductase subunit C